MNTAARQFHAQVKEKAADLAHRATIQHAIASYDVAVAHGKSRFRDWEEARRRCAAIKHEAISNLDRYLVEFEQHVKERGGSVFWAATGEEARRYIVELAKSRAVQRVVKSKSMVTEEIHLSPALESAGIEVFETDLGEFIVQLRNEPPYHIVTPAMHLTRRDIAKLFAQKLKDVTSDDPVELVAAARRALREAFFSADMGISGANFLVAETGMIALTTNEGNGRLTTALPRIQVAVAGIEKIIPRVSDLAVLWPTLATAGTGQHLTTYNTLIGGPRTPGEIDGPEEFHVVLLDNGRTGLMGDPEQRDVLRCIRCGACLNACPVFRTIGGHAYGTTYQGPIGSVLTPHLRGLHEFQHLSYASSLCGNCTSVCPVNIDLHHHLLHNRRNAVRHTPRPLAERIGFRLWRWAMMGKVRFRLAGTLGGLALRLTRNLGLSGTKMDPMRAWDAYRVPPEIPKESFRKLWRRENVRR